MRNKLARSAVLTSAVLVLLTTDLSNTKPSFAAARTYLMKYTSQAGQCEIEPARLSAYWVVFQKGDDIEIARNVNGVGVTQVASARLKPDGSFNTFIRMFGERLPCSGGLTEEELTVQIGPTASGCTVSFVGTRFRPGQNVAPGPPTPREGGQPQWPPGASAPTGFDSSVSITHREMSYRSECRGRVCVVTSPADDSTFNPISTERADQFYASLRLRVQHGVAGIFLTPNGEVGPYDGDLLLGRDSHGFVLQRYDNVKWVDLPATFGPSVSGDIDWFEITKDGASYEFRVNGIEVGRWNKTGASKEWVLAFVGPAGSAEFYEWQVSKPAPKTR